ncbi:NnrS family protein [uncultured Amaricoccus sp.]|uniref:NnrS family protein n=1 Tax=uncultured Amaricoccus sp. TaxID=339341 RepID=UPI00261F28A4|nr:NnrS family protein [uncultured Amaricoccus sp.]
MARHAPYHGPILFSYGFRPFFLGATLLALGVIPVWLAVWQGAVTLAGPFAPVDWHVHEMLFGYAAAVIAGFLFTAIPNWTGRMPTRGWPLMMLAALWLLGRLAVAGLLALPPVGVMALDGAFLLAIAGMAGVEIVAGRNWRNLMVLAPVTLLFAANLTFHLEAMLTGTADVARRLAVAVVIFLITLIGGRIIPSFTRNWLVQHGARRLPVPFGRYDNLCLAAGALALVAWTARPEGWPTALLLALAGLLHLARLARWRGEATWPSPLLLMLHLAYLFVPLGLLATAGAALGLLPAAAGLHLLGIGAIGGMTVAVMMRATRGHTGRSLVAGPWLTAAFALVALAALVRAASAGVDGITVSAALWTAGYGILAANLAPWLVRPNPARRTPSRPAAPATPHP